MNLKANRLFAILLMVVSGAVVVASCASKKTQGEGTETAKKQLVTVKAATAKDVDQIEKFTGTVEGYNTSNISPQSAVRIQSIFVEVGDNVRAGQRLAQMDTSNLTSAALQMENNKIEFERAAGLYEVGGISKSEYDSRKMAYDVSVTSYNNLVQNTYLISPINGIVAERNYDAGDMYLGGNPLFVVEQIRPVKIKISAPESVFGSIKKGAVVDITFDTYPGVVFKGKVHIVYPSIDASTRTFQVEIIIDNQDGRVRPGMFARVTFNKGVEHNIVVPDVAVVKQVGSGDRYVYTVVDGKVVFNKVELGQIIGTEYEIKSGLNEGDMVIIGGQYVVTNGQEVETKVGEPASFTPDNI